MKLSAVRILTAVNAANVSKEGGRYFIKQVVPVVDGVVMNSGLYPADELKSAYKTLDNVPAPAGHPKNAEGQPIPALNVEALSTNWIGAYCVNARREGSRTLVDVVVNESQAKAMPLGQELIDRLDAAINGTNADPIHVSTGLFCRKVQANGQSNGKEYKWIATDMRFDHVAILLNETGAATPEQGVGLFVNGEELELETVELNAQDKRTEDGTLKRWIRRLVGNESGVSFKEITQKLSTALGNKYPDSYPYILDVYSNYIIYELQDVMYRLSYAVDADGNLSLLGDPQPVKRTVDYEPVANRRDGGDPMKESMILALNSAGIKTDGLTDAQILDAYNQLSVRPILDKLAGLEKLLTANADQELTQLAEKLAVNSDLTVDELKSLGAQRLRELSAKSTPIRLGAANQADPKKNEFEGYSLNTLIDEGTKK